MAHIVHMIPPITHPLGKHWNQPKLEDINFLGDFATMDQKTFDELANYSHSQPSGVYEGKMWRCKYQDGWYLHWYVNISDDRCETKYRKIKIV